LYRLKKKENYTDLNIPFTGNLFVGFKQALGFKESKNKEKNSLGYIGKVSIYADSLKAVGISNPEFLRSSKKELLWLLFFLLSKKQSLIARPSSKNMMGK
jgi:hypothetical protein